MKLFIILFMSYIGSFCRLTPEFIRGSNLSCAHRHSKFLGFNKMHTANFNSCSKDSLFWSTNVASLRTYTMQGQDEDGWIDNFDFFNVFVFLSAVYIGYIFGGSVTKAKSQLFEIEEKISKIEKNAKK